MDIWEIESEAYRSNKERLSIRPFPIPSSPRLPRSHPPLPFIHFSLDPSFVTRGI